MGDALLILAIGGWLTPFVLEFVCRGARSISDSTARAVIGSIAAYMFLIHVVATFNASSRITFVVSIVLVAIGWIIFRMSDLLEVAPSLSFPKNWIRVVGPTVFVGVAATSVLIQPHFSYSGYLIDSVGVTLVQNEEVLTPYFSDEWASVAFVDQALTTGGLPTKHPFVEQSSYVSYMTPYFMGLAAFFSTFGFDPILQFAYAPFFLGLVLVYAAYVCARSFGASRVASSIAALTIPFIANSANLAGIWYAIPAHAGLLIFIFTFSLQKESLQWRMLGYALSVLLYPPMLVFVIPVALVTEKPKIGLKVLGSVFATGIVAVIIAAFSSSNSIFHSFKSALKLLVRPLGLDFAGDIPLYAPHVVIPAIAIAGCVAAIPLFTKKMQTVGIAIVVGFIGWIVYSIIAVTVVIDVQRVVFITAYLVCVAAALGYDRILAWIQKVIAFNPKIVAWAVLVLVFSHVSPSYSADESWRKFVLPTPNRGEGTFLIPSPPATQYLIKDDLDLLARFDVVASSSPRRFVTTPWKGLVLGTVTRHTPLHTKSSIVGTAYLKYEQIATANCDELEVYRVKFDIDFAYVPKLETCPDIVPVATSTEGFVLYEFHTQKK